MRVLARELAIAARLARAAGEAIERIRTEGFEATTKADDSPVTRADLEADAIIARGFSEAFPADGLLSEEAGATRPGTSGRLWIVDPLDGTRGFVDGTATYAVQIGLTDGREPVLGVVYEPHTRRLYTASRGGGTRLDDAAGTHALTVRQRPRSEMRLVTSTRLPETRRAALTDALGVSDAGPRHSVGVKVGALVRGEADIYVGGHAIKLWDSCGPLVVLREAGGQLTHATGAPFAFDPAQPRHAGPFVATTGAEHQAICDVVRGVFALQ